MSGCVLMCVNVWGGGQERYLQRIDPAVPMRIIAVTGTNGKTTISRLWLN